MTEMSKQQASKNQKTTQPHRCTAILLAAGKGLRVGGTVCKQYLTVGGAPLLIHSIRTMAEDPVITDLVVLCPAGDEKKMRALLAEWGITGAGQDASGAQSGQRPAHSARLRAVLPGGAERYHSVHNGLEAITWPCDYVFIQDCARPFLDHETIARLYAAVQRGGACVAGMPSKDTIKIADAEGYVETTPNRAQTWIIQTPQVFSFDLIRGAYRNLMEQLDTLRKRGISITDDAMVAEHMTGTRVRLIEASYRNIKVTTPEDLLVAEAFFSGRNDHE